MTVDPKVSILMPAYNAEKYISAAIESILSQSLTDLELLIIDDGSRDKTVEIITSFTDSRIRLMKNKMNLGVAATRNAGIAAAKGEYIALLDADDVALPGRLEKQVAFLDANPDYGLVGTWAEIWEENRRTDRGLRHPTENEALRFNLLFDSYFVNSSAMFRREVFSSIGCYSIEPSRGWEDFELWSRIMRDGRYKLANIPEVLLVYREVPTSLTREDIGVFRKNVANICAKNLAWASGRNLSDPVIGDMAAFTHYTRRLSPKPDLAAMRVVLHASAARVGGKLSSDSLLDQEVKKRYKKIRNAYYRSRMRSLWSKITRLFSPMPKGETRG